ncbi:MAG TPA: 2-dehydropantoate 2-reductase [Candidatus Acidoferrales bacterium]|nr:2-dehydropantoate 2-reductase [Candidatus Acidoferrales bacterium]
MSERVCIIGCGSIGSLFAAHLARVCEVWAFVRRREHGQAIEQRGIRVSGGHEFTARLRATADPAALPACGLGIVCAKANDTADAIRPVAGHFREGAVVSAQNGFGCEEIIAAETGGWVIRGTTFMSGTRHDDNHVQLELDAPTWLGPFEPSATPFPLVEEAARLIATSGLKAEALADARPAQWSKLIFNSSVNAVAALTGLPHCPAFAAEREFGDLGHLLRALVEEGKGVARARGVMLREDPWEMNCIGARTNHPPSMLYDVQHRLKTEVDFLGGAIAREAMQAGVPAPLHAALYRLVKGKEASWTWRASEPEPSPPGAPAGRGPRDRKE